jgi:hypothetical protein
MVFHSASKDKEEKEYVTPEKEPEVDGWQTFVVQDKPQT